MTQYQPEPLDYRQNPSGAAGNPPHPQPSPQPSYGPAVGGNAAHPARGTATAAMWLSILGFFCLPFIGSIIAIVLARSAQRAGYPGGRARAAAVLGWLGIVLGTITVAYEGLSWLFS